MASFGSLGHVLTNHGGAWSDKWECHTATGSGFTGTYIYSAQNSGTNVHDIKFVNGSWLDGSSLGIPTFFGTSATDSTSITPTSSDENLYLYYGTSNLLAHVKNDGFGSSSSPPLPYVTWYFPSHVCGQNTYVGVTHINAQSNSTTYYVHELGVGQIGTIIVGTGAYPSTSGTGNFLFNISARTIQVISPGGALLGQKVFTCPISSGKKVHTNFW